MDDNRARWPLANNARGGDTWERCGSCTTTWGENREEVHDLQVLVPLTMQASTWCVFENDLNYGYKSGLARKRYTEEVYAPKKFALAMNHPPTHRERGYRARTRKNSKPSSTTGVPTYPGCQHERAAQQRCNREINGGNQAAVNRVSTTSDTQQMEEGKISKAIQASYHQITYSRTCPI